jgi:hypothetical protein
MELDLIEITMILDDYLLSDIERIERIKEIINKYRVELDDNGAVK